MLPARSGAERHCSVKSVERFESTEYKWIEYRLTRNPFRNRFGPINLFAKRLYHFEQRFSRSLLTTTSVKGFTKALPNCDVKMIKFPSGHLSDTIVSYFNLDPSESSPVRPPEAVGASSTAVAHVHVRTTVSRSGSCYVPHACSLG